MEDTFLIEFEVEESEKVSILERLRGYFLQEGFIVERETNSHIELYRPMPVEGKKESVALAWSSRIWINVDGRMVRIVVSMKKLKIVRLLTMVIGPIVEIGVGVGGYLFFKVPLVVPLLLIISGIATPFIAYFLFENIYRSSVEYFGSEIQKVIG